MKRESDLDDAIAALQSPAHTEAWLLGQPPLRKYLDFIEDSGLLQPGMPRTALVREWSDAARYYEELETREENIADHPAAPPLDPSLAPLIAEVMASPRYSRTFDKLPCNIEMVDLAHLVVCQNHVTHTFVEALMARLGPAPDAAALLRFCLPLRDDPAPFEIRPAGPKRYAFRSASTDFRFHEPVMLQGSQLGGHAAFGAVAGALALVVGFSCNFLNAVRDDDRGRLLLHNGYHRACALLSLGIRHAPCVVQTVGSRDELDIVAKALVASDPGYFFNAPRPPLLKDFLDPRLRKLVPIKKMSRVIEISYDIRDYFEEE
ncbi:hypothetical protein IP92_05140 [Pseudoduganella flava]|uniref:Uncharacterized protein n=1 Tax=Pseudoduganella flava TaxID=871742 RepID=A0A562PGJ1_9BURK|nr:hypothetical protein [Pseudoduganella flava]QGZ40380.1 hypothetical protein GO485_15840 [Pseudoduganella flava]TWI43575.1 hypothetical protein IP92_05140 [Pseudoduganella flava]